MSLKDMTPFEVKIISLLQPLDIMALNQVAQFYIGTYPWSACFIDSIFIQGVLK